MSKTDLHGRLVQEAMRMLDESPEALTLRAVARAAGVSAMAPYRHFADKAALMGAVKQEGFERLRLVLRDADATAEDGEALVRQGFAYLDFAFANPALFRLMFSAPEPELYVPDGEADTAYGVLARRVARLAPDAPGTATTAAWSIVHGLTTLTLDGRLPRGDAHARAVLELFVAGLAARRC
jgi:AcrR family transcriptional regulator